MREQNFMASQVSSLAIFLKELYALKSSATPGGLNDHRKQQVEDDRIISKIKDKHFVTLSHELC